MVGFEPTGVIRSNGFQDRPFQPLKHTSVFGNDNRQTVAHFLVLTDTISENFWQLGGKIYDKKLQSSMEVSNGDDCPAKLGLERWDSNPRGARRERQAVSCHPTSRLKPLGQSPKLSPPDP